LRDDDALQYNYALNPFSNGLNTEDNQYANVLEYTHIFGQRWWASIHGENYQDFEKPNDFSLNGIGGSLVYRVPETQIWNRGFLQEIGVSYNNYLTDRQEENVDEVLTNIIGSVALNLKPDPVNFILSISRHRLFRILVLMISGKLLVTTIIPVPKALGSTARSGMFIENWNAPHS